MSTDSEKELLEPEYLKEIPTVVCSWVFLRRNSLGTRRALQPPRGRVGKVWAGDEAVR